MGGPVIAIDGPAGVGKSTLARRLAEEFGLPYVNTGLMYRAVAAAALEEGVDVDDGLALAELSRRLRFDVSRGGELRTLLIEGEAPSGRLTSVDVERVVSAVSRHPEVRAVLREEQRRVGREGAVMEGRDIGSVVFPEAAVKLFLEAAPDERASRRMREREAVGHDVAEALHARDRQDERVNPLTPASDAVPIDTTSLDPEDVFRLALDVVRHRLEERR